MRPVISLLFAVLIWATTFVVSEDALVTTSPAVLTILRFVLAAVTLVPLALCLGSAMRTIVTRPIGMLLGLTGVATYYGLQNLGLLYTTAGTAALLQAVLPIATALLAAVFLGERVTHRVVVGLALGTAGVALVSFSAARLGVGALLIISGVLSYGVYTVALRHYAQGATAGRDALAVAAVSSVWGVLFLAPWLAWEMLAGQARWPTATATWWEVLYLGVVASGLTLLLWSYGAARTAATVSGIFTAGIPAFGYAFAVLLGEPATWPRTLGGVMAVCGMVLAAWPSRADSGARLAKCDRQ
ncbi:MAG TPA: DMT family transporter [Mycobacterium sp.]|nr:DMT family transporter [Mycobacterium sp.]